MPNDGVVAQAPNYPTDLVYNARFQNSPKTVAGQALGSLGNSIPDLIKQMIQAQQQKKFQEMLSSAGLNPQQQALSQMVTPENAGQTLPAISKLGQSGINPYQQANIDYKNKELSERQREFDRNSAYKTLVADLNGAKSKEQIKLAIDKFNKSQQSIIPFMSGPTINDSDVFGGSGSSDNSDPLGIN